MKTILFLCVANSARSQIAEALARDILRDILDSEYRIVSAGSAPSFVHPLALQVLAEEGLDASSQYSKAVTELDISQMDVIVTLCAEEVCPTVPGRVQRFHWPLQDPARPAASEIEQVQQFRQVRDQIRSRLETLKAALESSNA